MTEPASSNSRSDGLTQAARSPLVGVLGAGQLGRMLGIAGLSLGVRCRFLDEPASEARPSSATGDVIDVGFTPTPDQLDRFLNGLDAVTYEFENVPSELARAIASRTTVRPSDRSLEAAQDRLLERELFTPLGIVTPQWKAAGTLSELQGAIEQGFPLPAIVKTRRMGYDGKGQAWIRERSDAKQAWDAIAGSDTVDAIIDEVIPFVREISVVAVRGADGETRCYPPVENVHRNGILVRSIAPAPRIDGDRQAELERAARLVANELDHVGVLAVEFFEAPDGRLLANEFAPRVHNTGHWTIEGAETSQFENHLRAVLGLPLGSCSMKGGPTQGIHASMINVIGEWPERDALLSVPGACVHDYEKHPKGGRKIGHVTVTAPTPQELDRRIESIELISGLSPTKAEQ